MSHRAGPETVPPVPRPPSVTKYIGLLVIGLTLAACSRQDQVDAKRQAHEAGQELKRDLQEAKREVKKGTKELSHELDKDLHEAKREVNGKR